MKLAAIDIGSNAVRLVVKEVTTEGSLRRTDKVAHCRVPIRLGEDVFSKGSIGQAKEEALGKALSAFTLLMEAMGVEAHRACATSAMREAENGAEVADRLALSTGVRIELIRGKEEADLIFSNFEVGLFDPAGDYVYIDVGGGSTELTLIRHGRRIEGRSFKMGAVRLLEGFDDTKVWGQMEEWCGRLLEEHRLSRPIAIGAGGNINRLFKLAGCLGNDTLAIGDFKALHEELSAVGYVERMLRYQLKPDRADVIVPAGGIYLRAMELVGAQGILVPKVGLADGIVLDLHRRLRQP